MDDILKAINDLVAEKYPDDMVYVKLLPKDFKRPSTLIETESVERSPVGKRLIAVSARIMLTCYVETGGHYESDTEALSDRQNGILSLFDCGYLKVGERCLEVQAASGGMDFAESYIELQFDYFDDRPDESTPLPKMKKIKTKLRMEG